MRVAVVVIAVLLGVAAAAPAAGAAVATTGAAKDVGQTTATVTGTIDPQGSDTKYRFEYGTSTSYGLTTAEQSAGSGSDAVAVEAALTGLTSDTTYHYRLVATNGGNAGEDRTFTTAAAPGPPAATTGSARSITTSGARLTASVDPNGHATTYRFEYGTTTRYGKQTAQASAGSGASAVSVSASITGLKPHTRYHYRVVATNAAGVDRGRDRTFTTLRNPSGFTASASPNPVTWGGVTTLTGRLSGQGVGGTTVALERQDFPFTGPFYLVGTKATSRSGSFSFKIGPIWALARMRLTSRTAIVAVSPIIEVRSALRVGLRTRRLSGGRVRLQGSISPAVPRGRASLQKRSPRGRWVVVRRAGVRPLRGGRSRYRFTVRRRGTYRVVVLPRDNFAHVRGTSRERRVRGG